MPKDYYAILGVSKTASPEEIKKSFRRLAHEHHPDKGGDAQKFKDANEAYQVLGDKEKRAQYDQFGSAAFENGGMGGPGGFGGFGGFNQGGFSVNMDEMGDLGDVLGGMFGFGGGRAKQNRGANIEVDVTLDFLESVKGVDKKIRVYKHDSCSVCKGNGAEPGTKLSKCKTCDGKGAVQRSQRTIFGTVQMNVPCTECGGKGEAPESPCKHCKGSGIERREKELEVHIPAGISDGEGLRIDGEGENPGHGGKSGDLFVRIHVKQHSLFNREGNDIRTTVEVPFSLLSLGGTATVETIDGPGELKIPEGTSSGTVFRLRAKGVPFLRSNGRGDHYVTVQPEVKSRPTKEQRKLLEDLRSAGL
ncbi:MAG: molecular chaperone DnaJ [Patescibacteria group bacterium]|jgi:molecular chaperone DnaJ